MLIKLIAPFLLICISLVANAKDDSQVIAFADSQQLITAIKAATLAHAKAFNQSDLQTKLQVVDINLDPKLPAQEVAFSAIETQRTISVSIPFIEQLQHFIRQHPQLAQHDISLNELFVHAINDIVLHEVGHHALNAFYNDYTPPRYIPGMEIAAQEWANQMKINLDIDEHGVGRLIVLLVLQHIAQAGLPIGTSSPEVENFQNKIAAECITTYSQYATWLCDEWS